MAEAPRRVSAISRNILANALGGGWMVLLTLAVIPFQLGILGAEAYGLLGIMTMVQTVFALLDLGLNTTLTQGAAQDRSTGHQTTRQLAATTTAVHCALTFVAGIALAAQASWLSLHWLRLTVLPADTVADGIRLMALAVVLRGPSLVCWALLAGLNRLDVLNLLKAATQTLRLGGGLVVLFVWRELLPLLWWEIAVTIIELAVYFAACRRLLPRLSAWPRFTATVMRGRWHYALGINAVSAIAMLLTQTDRFAISRQLPLEMLGFYQIAFGATAWISLIQGGFNSAVLPSLAADFAGGRQAQLRTRNAKTTQLTVYAVALPAFALFFFSTEILGLWVGREAAATAAVTASLLSAGFLLNAAVSNCHTLAVASGNSAIPLRINLVGLTIYLPALALLLNAYGIAGAALAWFLLNVYYLLVMVPVVQKQILAHKYLPWLQTNFLPFVLLGGAVFGGAHALAGMLSAGNGGAVTCVIAAAVTYVACGFHLLERELREQISALAGGLLRPRTGD